MCEHLQLGAIAPGPLQGGLLGLQRLQLPPGRLCNLRCRLPQCSNHTVSTSTRSAARQAATSLPSIAVQDNYHGKP